MRQLPVELGAQTGRQQPSGAVGKRAAAAERERSVSATERRSAKNGRQTAVVVRLLSFGYAGLLRRRERGSSTGSAKVLPAVTSTPFGRSATGPVVVHRAAGYPQLRFVRLSCPGTCGTLCAWPSRRNESILRRCFAPCAGGRISANGSWLPGLAYRRAPWRGSRRGGHGIHGSGPWSGWSERLAVGLMWVPTPPPALMLTRDRFLGPGSCCGWNRCHTRRCATRRAGTTRHYPAHLDVREVRHPKDWAGAWWAYWYNLPPQRWPLRVPAATYDLCRERRDLRRWREEVRRSVRLRRVTAGLPVGAWQWLAELPDGSPVGELRARRRGGYPSDYGAAEPAVVLDSVFVVSDCRRLGIARRLMAELTAEMDRSEIQVARVVVDHGEVRFYAACGFQVEATRPVKLTLTRPRPSAWPA